MLFPATGPRCSALLALSVLCTFLIHYMFSWLGVSHRVDSRASKSNLCKLSLLLWGSGTQIYGNYVC